MTRRSTSFLIAACLSGGLHAAIFLALPRYEVGGVVIEWPESEHRPVGEMTVSLEVEPGPKSPEESEAALESKVEPEPQVELEPEPVNPEVREFEMGAADGTGYASHDIPDKADGTAPEADTDQAFLSLDPLGTGQRGADPAVSEAAGEGSTIGEPGGAPSVPPPAAHAMSPPPTLPPVVRIIPPKAAKPPRLEVKHASKLPQLPPQAPTESGVAVQRDETRDDDREAVTARPPQLPQPPQKSVATKPPPTKVPMSAEPVTLAIVTPPSETSPPTRPPTPASTVGGSRAGGSQEPAADPARMSDSESDPFSRLGTATIRDGRLQIRFGRKVKTRRPHLLLAAQADLLTLGRTQVVLKVAIDETGKVTGVDVEKSSGSNEIDQPTRVAVYEWWFEPKKDADGNPVADEVQFTIGWR